MSNETFQLIWGCRFSFGDTHNTAAAIFTNLSHKMSTAFDFSCLNSHISQIHSFCSFWSSISSNYSRASTMPTFRFSHRVSFACMPWRNELIAPVWVTFNCLSLIFSIFFFSRSFSTTISLSFNSNLLYDTSYWTRQSQCRCSYIVIFWIQFSTINRCSIRPFHTVASFSNLNAKKKKKKKKKKENVITRRCNRMKYFMPVPNRFNRHIR